MLRVMRWLAGCAVVGLGLGLLVSCQPRSPEEKLEILRSHYSATLNSIDIKPLDVAESTTVEEEAGNGSSEQPADDRSVGPSQYQVVLDILISSEAFEKLPGITLDVSHVDSERQEKEHHRLWVDTSDLERGGGTQISHTLEGVDYAEGDGFHVEVRSPVPPAERSQYREFSQ